MGVCQVPLLLAGVALCGLLGATAGPHSLCYNITVTSQDGFVHTRFFAEGRLDDEPFLHYDSDKGRAEPHGPKAQEVLGAETWDTETQDVAERGKKLRATLADINTLQELKGGSHSLQETWGCQTQEDNRTRGFWEFHYDGELFLSYRPETHSWMVHPSSAKNLAVNIMKQWEEDPTQSKASWAHVQGDVCETLQSYLRSRMDLKIKTGKGLVPPSPRSVADIVIIIAAAAAAVIITGLCVYFWKKRRTACSAGGSDLRSQQVLDQQLLALGDPTGTAQLELRPQPPAPALPVLVLQFP